MYIFVAFLPVCYNMIGFYKKQLLLFFFNSTPDQEFKKRYYNEKDKHSLSTYNI